MKALPGGDCRTLAIHTVFFCLFLFLYLPFSVVQCEDAAERVAMTNSKVFALETEHQRETASLDLMPAFFSVPQFKYQPVIASTHPKLVFFCTGLRPELVSGQ